MGDDWALDFCSPKPPHERSWRVHSCPEKKKQPKKNPQTNPKLSKFHSSVAHLGFFPPQILNSFPMGSSTWSESHNFSPSDAENHYLIIFLDFLLFVLNFSVLIFIISFLKLFFLLSFFFSIFFPFFSPHFFLFSAFLFLPLPFCFF